jgi:hypothetical protein
MIGNLKMLGVVLAAVFAVAALAVPAAQAEVDPAHFTAQGNSGTIEVTEHPGEGTQLFTIPTLAFSCDDFSATDHFEGGKGGSTTFEELTLEEVSYGGVCNFSGLEATVDFDDCHYMLENPSWDTEAEDARSDLALGPEGCSVTIDIPAAGCQMIWPGGQTFEEALTYTNAETAETEELTIHADFDGIAYRVICNSEVILEAEDGSYEGTLTAKAFDTGDEQVDLTVTPTTP